MKKRFLVLFLCVLCGLLCLGHIFLKKQTEGEEIVVNGVNINQISKDEALLFFDDYIDKKTSEITLDIYHEDKVWCFNGSNFRANSKIHTVLDDLYSYEKFGDYSKKINTLRQIKKMGFDNYIALNFTFRGIDEKIDGIISEIEEPAISSEIIFNPTSETFNITPSKEGVKVNRDKLIEDILTSLQTSSNIKIKVKTFAIKPEYTEEILKKSTKKQASFETSFKTSIEERKHNIKLCAKTLNGVKVSPLQTFSFNDIIGIRSEENGYKTAKIIKNGEFVEGVGGGICQVSTTLYNALLLSGINVCEVHKHSLPVSYINPSLDAMVSWGSADLKFKNETATPIFISCKCENDKLKFTIYGDTKNDNISIKTRSEIVDTIKPSGDKIIKDVDKKYIDKIMFKGEFLRVKFAKNGYVSRAYLDFYENGHLKTSKLIRSDKYDAQCGIVYEGTEDLIEGFVLPKDTFNSL